MSKNPAMSSLGELSDELFTFKEVIWNVPSAYILPDILNYEYKSPSFLFANATWALCLSPYRCKPNNTVGSIDLGVQRLESTIPEHHVYAKFYFKTNRGKEFEPLQDYYIFDKINTVRSMLYSEKREFSKKVKALVKERVFTIVCQMRTKNFNRVEESSHKELMEPVMKSSLNTYKQQADPSASTSKELTMIASKQKLLPPTFVCKGCECTSQHSTTLKNDYKDLFLKQEDCDVIMKVKGREFPAHRTILRARSPVFASTFRNDMKEKATGVIDIKDCDPSSFSDFLCFLYCGSVEILSTANVFSLFTAADKYDVQDLRSECLEFIKKNLSVDTFCDTVTLALQHSERELIELTTDFLGKNLNKILVSVQWQSFLIENPIQGNELLIKALPSIAK